MSSNLQSMFQALDESFSKAEANDGTGSMGVWPPDGPIDLLVVGMEVEPTKVDHSVTGREIDAARITFEYQPLEAEAYPDVTTFRGIFTLALNMDDMEGASRKVPMEIDLGRLRQHLKVILGQDVTPLTAAMQQASDLLSGDEAVAVSADIQSRQGKGKNAGRSFRSEYLLKRLEAA